MTKLATRGQVIELDEAGHSAERIAQALGIPERRVERILDPDAPKHDFAFLDREPPPLKSKDAKPARKPATGNKGGRPATEREHGTMRGVNQHHYRKEPWCTDCRAVYNAAKRAKKANA